MPLSKGFRHSTKTKKKIAKARKGKPHPHKGQKFSEKAKINMSKSQTGIPSGMLGKHHSEETKKKMRKSRIKFMVSGKVKLKATQIENTLEQELKRQGISYMKQAPVEGIAVVDFLLADRIIIEADGNYWHSRKINKGRDIARDTILTFKGYKIYRFTQTQINKSVRRCINKIFKERR